MKTVVLFVLLSLFSFALRAETAESEGSEITFRDTIGWPDDIEDIFDNEGWTPRYAYVHDDNFIGHSHYFGMGYYRKTDTAHEGPTLRLAVGNRGEKLNLAYTDGFSFFNVDFGLSYFFLDADNPRDLNAVERIGLELGLRMWVVQVIGVHTEESSYVSLAYGF